MGKSDPGCAAGRAATAAVAASVLVIGLSSCLPRTPDRPPERSDAPTTTPDRPIGRPFVDQVQSVTLVALGELDGALVAASVDPLSGTTVWDVADRRPLGELIDHSVARPEALALVTVDGAPALVTGDWFSDPIDLVDLTTRQVIRRFGDGDVLALAVGELDGRQILVSGNDDRRVRAWDLATGDQIGGLQLAYPDPVWPDELSVAFGTLAGAPIAVSSGMDRDRYGIWAWNIVTGEPVSGLFVGHTDVVRSVAVGEQDGTPVVVSGSDDGTVRVWDLGSGRQVGPALGGHNGPVTAVAFGALGDTPIAVSGGRDGTVRVWDLDAFRQVYTSLVGHPGTVASVAFGTLDGRPIVVSGGSAGGLVVPGGREDYPPTLWLWDLSRFDRAG